MSSYFALWINPGIDAVFPSITASKPILNRKHSELFQSQSHTHASQTHANQSNTSIYAYIRLLTQSGARTIKGSLFSLQLSVLHSAHFADFPVGGRLPLTNRHSQPANTKLIVFIGTLARPGLSGGGDGAILWTLRVTIVKWSKCAAPCCKYSQTDTEQAPKFIKRPHPITINHCTGNTR